MDKVMHIRLDAEQHTDAFKNAKDDGTSVTKYIARPVREDTKKRKRKQ